MNNNDLESNKVIDKLINELSDYTVSKDSAEPTILINLSSELGIIIVIT